ncbi:MAG: DUF2723 domain-containing protein [Bacteroidales bacterium]|nr:DUF2723 domain-containing protein [Candidatus Physcousia equi]
MKQFRLVDNLMGWLIFAVAAWTYCSTIEPTASFWDCPEFITTGYKLEVGHPPGAPFFMLTANIFSQFVSDPAQVAKMVNIMSALFSALCILFLYWTISHLVRRLICKGGIVETTSQLITTQVSAAVGALAYCWSDTFWFSAVEGEVYAYSSLFTALVVWLMLKWEDHADEPHSDRWLILIAYMTGLSVGVHLLNLLCLPALVLIWYYRKHPNANLKGSLWALLVSFGLIVVVLYGIVPGIVKVGGWFELLFVNGLGCSFNTGLIIYIILLVSCVLWAIWESNTGRSLLRGNIAYMASVAMLGIPFYGHGASSIFIGILILLVLGFCLWHKDWVTARFKNTSLLCMLLIMVGYSSYAVIVIRSTANCPMDQNSPEDIFTLGQYLSREQYGDRPLLYGQVYNSPIEWDANGNPVSTQGAPVYQQVEKANPDEPDRYRIVRYDNDYKYQVNMLFPRMYSNGGRHPEAYESLLGGIKGRQAMVKDRDGSTYSIKVPTFWENMEFFFSYQVNFMYMRYFMWNFAGRQNDIQGNGELEHGNWITGISVLDDMRLGDQDKLPDDLKNNKGHNVYYMLPLLLGLIGLFWHICYSQESVKQFWIVFFLFFMTGLAIVIYLNQTPQQPRERDYAYAGSFYGFAIWIGLGVTAITTALNRLLKRQPIVAAILPCICLAVPIQMASQNWDDHDRSGRYTCRDFGQNYLSTLSESGNPIIFTNGDNDTFPLWYAQETEGFRTDARVCNLSYLQTDWYIDQMKRPSYDSPSLPISWKRLDYVSGKNEGLYIYPGTLEYVLDELRKNGVSEQRIKNTFGENPYDLRTIIHKWILNEDEELNAIKRQLDLVDNDGSLLPVIPTDSLVLPIDKEAVKRSGMMIASDADSTGVASIPDVMTLSFKGRRVIYKSEMMMYEMLCGCNWERPMYMSVTVGADGHGALPNYFVQEGLAYRITPFNTQESGKRVDSEKMYDNMMNKYQYGGLETPDIYLDETVLRMCYTHRRMFSQLINQLVKEGKMDKARKALEKCEKCIPPYNVPHTYSSGSVDLARAWVAVGDKKKAEGILLPMMKVVMQYLDWYLQFDGQRFIGNVEECRYYAYQYSQALALLDEIDKKQADALEKNFNIRYTTLAQRMEAYGLFE